MPTRQAVDKLLKDARVSVKPVMEFDNIETIKRAVEIEAGVAIVPHPTIAQELSDKTLAEVPLQGKDLFRPLAAIYKKTKVLSPAMKQFLAMLKDDKKSSKA